MAFTLIDEMCMVRAGVVGVEEGARVGVGVGFGAVVGVDEGGGL